MGENWPEPPGPTGVVKANIWYYFTLIWWRYVKELVQPEPETSCDGEDAFARSGKNHGVHQDGIASSSLAGKMAGTGGPAGRNDDSSLFSHQNRGARDATKNHGVADHR